VPVDLLSREAHHLDHILPSWLALPDALRGTAFLHKDLLPKAVERGVQAVEVSEAPETGPLTLVASYLDLKLARKLGRLVVYSEHGAGQGYAQADGTPIGSGSYVGAIDRAGVVAVLVPGRLSAERHRRSHPTIPAFEVGVPKLDELHREPSRRVGDKPVVAVSFHWECRVCPETRSAFRHYRQGLKRLSQSFELIGHGHPRGMAQFRRHYKQVGIEVVEDFNEVIERADVYCVDNSSTLYEWASLGRPVVVMNAPWYRKKLEHGLRFWSHADVGPQVSGPGQLAAGIEAAIADAPGAADRRQEIVADVYTACDGRGVKRASAALAEIAKEWG